jgi:phosphohistidine phosphatase
MKSLYLLRHAKAVPSTGTLQDFDRTLNDHGRAQARLMGSHFKQLKCGLDYVLSSTALRARETTELFLTSAQCVSEVRYEQRIYEASRYQLTEVVEGIDENKSRVLIVGHNPGLEELLQHLTGRLESMATGTLAKIDFEAADWPSAVNQKGHLDWLVRPNELP